MSALQTFFINSLDSASFSDLQDLRSGARESFKKLGIPTLKHEDWRYSSLKKISDLNFESKANPQKVDLSKTTLNGFGEFKIVFINGVYSAKDSSDFSALGVKVFDFKTALTEIPEVLEKHYGKYTENDKESLSALNVALAQEGAVIVVPANKTLEKTLVIQNLINLKSNSEVINLHHLVVMQENSEAKIVELFETEGSENAFENTITELVINKSARLDYYKIQNQTDGVYHVGTTQVWQDTQSYFYSATISLNGGFIRNNLNVVLDGEHIDNHLFGLYIPTGSQHVDNHSIVDHRKPNSSSNELYKGVLGDKSTGVFNGKIFVREDAQKTNAYQNCRNVLTSDSAVMNTKPQLEIWADDVKCSHGTTTGQLNDEAIFYMQSRGIPKKEAMRLQLVAFAEDVVSQIKIDELREILDELIELKLN
jgi:Fe-S cluster assembly protein SufD